MYLKIPEYSLIYFYIKKIEKLNNNLKLEYKSLEKIEKDKINFKIFDLYSINTHLLEKEKYFGTLEFNYYPKTNEVYVYKVPTIYLNNVKIPIFTSNIAKIIVKKLNKELLPKDIKLIFSSPFSILAIDRFVKQIIPSIEETKNMQLLNQIVNQIDNEIKLIENNSKKYKEKMLKQDIKKENVLKRRRLICDLDENDYLNINDFYQEVNQRLCQMWQKKINKLNRHLNATKCKYKKLILTAEPERLYKDINEIIGNKNDFPKEDIEKYLELRLKQDLSKDSKSVLSIINDLRETYFSEYKTCSYNRDFNCEYFEYLSKNQYYYWLAEETENFEHPIFYCEGYNYDNTLIFDKKRFVLATKYLLQIQALEKQLITYHKLLNNPNQAILNFMNNSISWNSIIRFPYWLKMEKDKYSNSKDLFYLLMIKKGVKKIDLTQLKIFCNDKDKRKKLSFDGNFKCDRLLITLPKTLDYLEIEKIIKFGLSNSSWINFVCETSDLSVYVKSICINNILSNFGCSKNIFVTIDPEYYENYFLDIPNNKNFWHRYDFSSNYLYHKKEIFSLNYQVNLAKEILEKYNILITSDKILEVVLGSYSNNERFKNVRNEYKAIQSSIEKRILLNFESNKKNKIKKISKV